MMSFATAVDETKKINQDFGGSLICRCDAIKFSRAL